MATWPQGAQHSDLADLRPFPAPTARQLYDLVTGAAAGVGGAPMDMLTLLNRGQQVARGESPLTAFAKPDEQIPGTSSHLSQLMGGDPRSGATLAGNFLSPSPNDLVKLAALAPDALHMAQNLAPGGALQAMTLFHGSPHKFDEFKLEKIGTGEGAQAYGHGLYFAEKPGVAEGYQKRLAKGVTPLLDAANPTIGKDMSQSAYDFLKGYEGIDEAIKGLRDTAANTPEYIAKAWRGREKQLDELNQSFKDAADWLESNRKRISLEIDRGHLYEVDIPDTAIDKMLDWDKPLSEQPESVRDILTAWQKERGASITDGASALKEVAFDRRMRGLDDSPAAVSKQLQEMGIPGIKYLDGTSRPTRIGVSIKKTPEGRWAVKDSLGGTSYFDTERQAKDAMKIPDGTRNFVVFDENIITPLKRNNEPLKK